MLFRSKRNFKKALAEATGCTIQHDGWCCGTCFFDLDYDNLTNADWQSLLYYRGDYDKKDLDNLPSTWQDNIVKIAEIIDRILV